MDRLILAKIESDMRAPSDWFCMEKEEIAGVQAVYDWGGVEGVLPEIAGAQIADGKAVVAQEFVGKVLAIRTACQPCHAGRTGIVRTVIGYVPKSIRDVDFLWHGSKQPY
jgi:hypothetical protein